LLVSLQVVEIESDDRPVSVKAPRRPLGGMEDRSLDEFLGSESSEDEQSGDSDEDGTDEAGEREAAEAEAEPAAAGDADGRPDPATVDPAESTSVYDPGGWACADCGEQTQRRWRQGDGFVCSSCKEW
jgi:hypothetical protein